MYVFGGCNRKRKKSTFVTPTVLFAPLQPVTPAQIDGSTSTAQSLVQMWPSPLVLLSSTTAWAAQPPVMSTSEHSFVQSDGDKVVIPFIVCLSCVYFDELMEIFFSCTNCSILIWKLS